MSIPKTILPKIVHRITFMRKKFRASPASEGGMSPLHPHCEAHMPAAIDFHIRKCYKLYMIHAFRRIAILPALLPALLPCTFSSCGRSTPGRLPNVILIVMDTARAENFGCYGYHRPTSPNIDEFSREATFYANAVASSPWTVPTHASIFTGKDPFEHGAHRISPFTFKNGVHQLDPRKIQYNKFANPLHTKHITLAEVFAAEGFATCGFIANSAYINHRFNMDQGFQTFRPIYKTSDAINTMVYEWLDTLSTDQFFLFINYMDTHVPYNAKPRQGFLEKPAPFDDGALQKKLWSMYLNPRGRWREDNPDELRQTVINQYDTAISNLDEQIGKLFDYLKEKKLYDRSVIVLTSDHGEMFGEHDLVSHGQDMYQQLLWIPLIIKNPHQTQPRCVETTISTSDIPHLIFSQLPRKITRKFTAEFLNAPGQHPIIAENYYAHPQLIRANRTSKNYNRIRTALFKWPYKYIHSSDDDHELYNIANDKGETENLLKINPELAAKFADQLRNFIDSRTHFDEIIDQEPLTEEEIKKLKSLGYIGD